MSTSHASFHACPFCALARHDQRSSIGLAQVLELITSKVSRSLKQQALDACFIRHLVHDKRHDLGHSGFPMTLTRFPRDHVVSLTTYKC